MIFEMTIHLPLSVFKFPPRGNKILDNFFLKVNIAIEDVNIKEQAPKAGPCHM